MNRIYISKSKKISESGAFFREALDFLRKNNISCSWFPSIGHHYDDERLKEAKGVIILLENSSTIIGKGVYTEIQLAKELGKPVFILYRRLMDFQFHFYSLSLGDIINETDWTNYSQLKFGHIMSNEVIEQFQQLCKVDENKSILNISEYKKEEIIVREFNNLELLLLRR